METDRQQADTSLASHWPPACASRCPGLSLLPRGHTGVQRWQQLWAPLSVLGLGQARDSSPQDSKGAMVLPDPSWLQEAKNFQENCPKVSFPPPGPPSEPSHLMGRGPGAWPTDCPSSPTAFCPANPDGLPELVTGVGLAAARRQATPARRRGRARAFFPSM